MDAREPHTYWDTRGLMLLWAAVLLAPTALAVDVGVGYPMVKWACATGNTYVLTVVSLAALAMAGAGIRLGWSSLVKLRETAVEDGGRVVDRSYFLAIVAIAVNVLVAIAVVTAAVPQLVLGSCE